MDNLQLLTIIGVQNSRHRTEIMGAILDLQTFMNTSRGANDLLKELEDLAKFDFKDEVKSFQSFFFFFF